MRIFPSSVRKQPRVIYTILSHTPTLDPLTIVTNSRLLCIRENGKVVSFVAIKKYSHSYELGTVYTYPAWRGKWYASMLIGHTLDMYSPLGLLCKKDMLVFYKRYGFVLSKDCFFRLKTRRKLFNIFFTPLCGYKIVSMAYEEQKR